jgi:hypothetical protein
MNLKEKFNVISCKDCNITPCDIKCTIFSQRELIHLEKVADQHAVDFTDWVNLNAYKFPTKTTTKELLEIYKIELAKSNQSAK